MIETIKLWIADADKTHLSGASLASTLYRFPVDILLSGPLGAGKTSFMQGFLVKLGIEESVTSPTYALEQRYSAKNGHDVLHIDLYRLKELQARELLLSTDTHEGIRSIEWADKAGAHAFDANTIRIFLSEKENGREAEISFHDMTMPTMDEIVQWRKDVRLPEHIISHCETVAEMTRKCSDSLIGRGHIVRKEGLYKAALVHDLFRFVDFKTGPSDNENQGSPEDMKVWEMYRERFEGKTHEQACAQFLREKGFMVLADIVESHGARYADDIRGNTEQLLLFYSDKRVLIDKIVSVRERYDYLRERYNDGKSEKRYQDLEKKTLEIEQMLFEGNPPF